MALCSASAVGAAGAILSGYMTMTDEKTEADAESAVEPAYKENDMAADTGKALVETEQLKAVFRMGSRQYCAGVGDLVSVPDFPNASKDPEQIYKVETEIRADVLMVTGDQTLIGTPSIPGAQITLELADINPGKRVINFKRRRRKHSSKRTKGHKWLVFDFIVKSLELPNSKTQTSAAGT